jgi:DNA polymerase-3 subunit gamma/tau
VREAFDDVPSDADAPPEDFEPPFDPGPEPDLDGPSAPSGPAPEPLGAPSAGAARAAAPSKPDAPGASARAPRPLPQRTSDGIQRYGEAVVREVLGATFLEEIEAPGFGERG